MFEVVTSSSRLVDLPEKTKIITPESGHVWWRTDRARDQNGPKWEGSGGMYSDSADLLAFEGTAIVIWSPDD